MPQTVINLVWILSICLSLTIMISPIFYKRYKWGLATKQFIACALTAILGVIFASVCFIFELAVVPTILATVGVTILALGAIVGVYKWILKTLQSQTTKVATATPQLAATVSQLAGVAEQQFTTVQEVGTTIEELIQTTKVAVENTHNVAQIAEESQQRGEAGLESLLKLKRTMGKINEIEGLVELVGSIADQSHLLSVNASIEAARAGEQGKAFSVVASEVRDLAQQSKEASKKIQSILRIVLSSEVQLEDTEGVVRQLNEVLESAAEKTIQAHGAMQQQSGGIYQIGEAMKNVQSGGELITSSANDIKNVTSLLNSSTAELKILVQGY